MSFDLDGDRAILYPMNTQEAYYLAEFARQLSTAGYDVRIDTPRDEFRVQIPLVRRESFPVEAPKEPMFRVNIDGEWCLVRKVQQ